MSTYYIAGYPVSDELYHYGVKGQSWGRRRFQNLDGSLTVLGRQHYDVGAPLDANGQPSTYQYRSPQQTQSQAQSQAQSSAQSRYAQQQAAQFQAQVQAQRQRMQGVVEVNDKTSVANAQRSLQNLGYDLKKYGADGKVGDETRSAINAFKRDHGMQQDGKLDLATSKMIKSESKNSLKKGAKGESVSRMQDTLKSLGYSLDKYGSDGKFGAETQKALNEFKKAHGLPENGVYDGVTRTAMARELAAKAAPAQSQYQPQSQTMTNMPQQPASTQPVNIPPANVAQDPQTTADMQSPQSESNTTRDVDAKDATGDSIKKKKAENKHTEQRGQRKTEQILKTLSDSGSQIADQHKVLSKALSVAAGKAGEAIGDAARKVSSAHGSLVSTVSSAASSVKDAADRRAKMYDGILETSRTVSASTLRIEKDIQRASDKLVKQHNKLVSELTVLSRDTRKAAKKTSKQAKKTARSISSFFNSARSTLDRGSNALASWFGI